MADTINNNDDDRSEQEPVDDNDNEQNGNDDTDLEANNNNNDNDEDTVQQQHKPFEVIRSDPIKALETRQRKLERQAALQLPEVHVIGSIRGGHHMVTDNTEGAFCRFKIEVGKAWEHLGGDLQGQTQVSYCKNNNNEMLTFNHPIDCHFAAAGLQGWGAARISFQSYKIDWCGRRILTGYGYAHIPNSPGFHQGIRVNLWRPTGSPEQEMNSFLLGHTPSLLTHDPIYETAWRERCRLVTVSSGILLLDLFVGTRFLKQQGVDERR